jgi:2-polyprenyl-3-methyl-5-hydroxy-6-metoxy-1,4-benzoquinol methylase
MDPANVPERRADPHSAREVYTHGYGERVVSEMARRSLTGTRGFLLPHLKPGMRVLDCGCGPGSITADVAEFVAPGEVIGVDIAPGQVEAARRRAQERGLERSIRSTEPV